MRSIYNFIINKFIWLVLIHVSYLNQILLTNMWQTPTTFLPVIGPTLWISFQLWNFSFLSFFFQELKKMNVLFWDFRASCRHLWKCVLAYKFVNNSKKRGFGNAFFWFNLTDYTKPFAWRVTGNICWNNIQALKYIADRSSVEKN